MALSYTTPPPPDFGGYRADVEAAYQRAATKAGTGATDTLHQYGFQGGGLTSSTDPTTGLTIENYGAPTNSDGSYKVDVTNQTGLIQRMLNSQGRSLTQQATGYRSHGLGNSGFAQGAEANSRYDAAGEQANLGNQFLQQFNQNVGDLSQATFDRGQQSNVIGRQEAGWNADQEWWKSMLEPPQSDAIPSQYTQISPGAKPGVFTDPTTGRKFVIPNAQNPDIIKPLPGRR